MNTRITRPLVESALLAALGAVMMLLAWYVPVIGTLLALVSPLPVAVTVIRHGTRWGVLSSLVTMFIVALFAGWIAAMALWVVNGAMGIAFGFAVRRNYRPTIVLSAACAGSLAGTIVGLISSFFITGMSLTTQLDESLATLRRSFEMSKNMFGSNPAIDQILAGLTREQALKFLPGSAVLLSIVLAYVNFEVFRRILPRLGYPVEPLPPFSRWIFPEIVSFALMFAFLGIRLPAYSSIPLFSQAIDSIFLVTTPLLTVEAIAVAAFFILRSGMSRGMTGLFLFMGVSLTVNTPDLGLLLILFGMIDVLFDFRHIRFEPLDEL